MRRAALCVLLVLAGCGGSGRAGPVPTPVPPSDEELIAAALDQRAAGIARERAGLGVRGARFVIEGVDRRGEEARVRARLGYGIRGVGGRFGARRTFLARRAGERWRIVRPLGERDAELWEIGSYQRQTSEHFVMWVLNGAIAPVRTLEAGYASLERFLSDLRLKRRYLVVVVEDGAAARRITRRIAGLDQLSALTDTQVKIGGPAERVQAVRSQRLIVNAAAFGASDPASQEQVIAHELTHAVLAPRTSTRTPGWLVEGVALYASADDRRAEYFGLPRLTMASLSAPDSISRLTGDAQRAGYATASAAAFYITDVYGEDALLDLLAVFNRADLEGDRGDPGLTDRAMRRVLGIGLAEFQERLG